MKKTTILLFTVTILAALTLGACQAPPVEEPVAAVEEHLAATATEVPVKPTATAVPTETEEPTATVDPVQQELKEAELVAASYFEAVMNGESDAAADYLSRFSLVVFEMTRDDAVEVLQARRADGEEWSDLEIKDVELFTDNTVLVSVAYTRSTPVEDEDAEEGAMLSVPVEEVWAVRLENDEWLLNWNQLIDFKTMSASSQTINNVTVLPTELLRYTDHIELQTLIQNRSRETVVFGQTNETLGTFYFGKDAVVADDTRCILAALRTNTDCVLSIQGLYEEYPEQVEIRKWKNYDVDPWYTFLLN
jgi:hypothetical protein